MEGIIRGHRLQRFVINPTIPARYLTPRDCDEDAVNLAFVEWEQQDSLLFTWLLSTLFETVLPRVVRCVHSYQVWDEIHKYFQAQTNTCSRQLRSELKSISKGNRSILEYLTHIQAIVDILQSIGDPVTHRDHLDAIVEGLLEEYEALSVIIQYRSGLCDILEAESMLLSHEAKLEKQKKLVLAEPLSINVAQAPNPQNMHHTQANPNVNPNFAQIPPNIQSQSNFQHQNPSQQLNVEDYSGGRQNGEDSGGGRGRRSGRDGGAGGCDGGSGGRSGGQSRVQCQICSKHGHDASICYH